MSKYTISLFSIATLLFALIVVIGLFFYLRSNDSEKYTKLYNDYNHYRDSALVVNKTLQHRADSISTIKQQIVTKIKTVAVYTEQLNTLPDSVIAPKVDSVYLSHNDNSFISPTVAIKVGATDAFIVSKPIAVDYISSAYLLYYYMSLDTTNNILLSTKDNQISNLITLEAKSNQTAIDFRLYSKELELKNDIYRYSLYGSAVIIIGILLLHK
jgi:hypothetical protein